MSNLGQYLQSALEQTTWFKTILKIISFIYFLTVLADDHLFL